MRKHINKTIGILGGMGPDASLRLCDLIFTKSRGYLWCS